MLLWPGFRTDCALIFVFRNSYFCTGKRGNRVCFFLFSSIFLSSSFLSSSLLSLSLSPLPEGIKLSRRIIVTILYLHNVHINTTILQHANLTGNKGGDDKTYASTDRCSLIHLHIEFTLLCVDLHSPTNSSQVETCDGDQVPC